MCAQCWDEGGRPANWSPDIKRALELVRDLYQINAVGGPLHAVLDDWNIEDQFLEPYYNGLDDDELDEPYYAGIPIADLPPEAPAVVEGLGRSMRQLCDEIVRLFKAMPVEDRLSVLAYHSGLADEPNEVER